MRKRQIVRFAFFFLNMNIVKADKIFDGEKFREENTVVIDDDNRILDILYTEKTDETVITNAEIYDGILCPGFINSHCHLELSYLHHQFQPHTRMTGFLNQMFEKRNLFDRDYIVDCAQKWDKKMCENGIVAAGDIVNTTDTCELKAKSKIEYLNFIEVFGLKEENAERIFDNTLDVYKKFADKNMKASIVPHSPYSLSEKLWECFFDFLVSDTSANKIHSFHFMESEAEKNIVENQPSELKNYFVNHLKFEERELSHLSEKFYTRLKKFLDLSNSVLLVHNTFIDQHYLDKLEDYREKVHFCLCPNANLFIENTLPDVHLIKNFSDNICIGTDSLASNFSLNIIDEMNVIMKNFKVKANEVLKWATSNGARALGIDFEFGYIKKGYRTPLNILEIKENQISLKKVIF